MEKNLPLIVKISCGINEKKGNQKWWMGRGLCDMYAV